jgi:hypothetical protein
VVRAARTVLLRALALRAGARRVAAFRAGAARRVALRLRAATLRGLRAAAARRVLRAGARVRAAPRRDRDDDLRTLRGMATTPSITS